MSAEPTTRTFVAALFALTVLPVGIVLCSPEWRYVRSEVAKEREKPTVKLRVVHRITDGSSTIVGLEAFLKGEPERPEDWLCVQPEWWVDLRARRDPPGEIRWCGELAPTRHFTGKLDLFGSGRRRVWVTLWNRHGKAIGSDHQDVWLPEN